MSLMRCLIFVAFCVVLTTSPTHAQRWVWFQKNMVAGEAINAPAPQVELTQVVALVIVQARTGNAFPVECAFLANHSDKVVGSVRVRFTYLGEDGSELGHDTKVIRGPIKAGASYAYAPMWMLGAAPPGSPNCQIFSNFAGGTGTKEDDAFTQFGYIVTKKPFLAKIASLRGTIDEVDFPDGTSWTPTAASPQPSATAS